MSPQRGKERGDGIGASLEGFIARANGDLDWLPQGGGEDLGYDAFMATVDALVIPLFGVTARDIALELIATRRLAGGLVQCEYEVVG